MMNLKSTPWRIGLAVVAVSVAPIVLNLFGVDFGSRSTPLDFTLLSQAEPQAATDAIYRSLSGSYTHTLLEWTATVRRQRCGEQQSAAADDRNPSERETRLSGGHAFTPALEKPSCGTVS